MLEFAIQHRETLTTLSACAGMIGIALMVLAWVFGRRMGPAVVRPAAAGIALTQILPATNGALGDSWLFGLVFGLSFLVAAAIAIRPQLWGRLVSPESAT